MEIRSAGAPDQARAAATRKRRLVVSAPAANHAPNADNGMARISSHTIAALPSPPPPRRGKAATGHSRMDRRVRAGLHPMRSTKWTHSPRRRLVTPKEGGAHHRQRCLNGAAPPAVHKCCGKSYQCSSNGTRAHPATFAGGQCGEVIRRIPRWVQGGPEGQRQRESLLRAGLLPIRSACWHAPPAWVSEVPGPRTCVPGVSWPQRGGPWLWPPAGQGQRWWR